jgi:C_GCAxxG_C_C family probable redox protein
MNKDVDLQRIKKTAEGYYRDGDYFCSEAIVRTIRDEFDLPLPDDVVAMASGFPVGIGAAGCTCGAIAGGVMALGLFFGRTEPRQASVQTAMARAKELHDLFKERHKSTCCRVLTKGMELGSPVHMEQCIALTGEVAEETARMIVRELAAGTPCRF